MKHEGIEIKFFNVDTFKKQIDVNFIDLDSELVDLNYKVASLIFCHFWRSIGALYRRKRHPCPQARANMEQSKASMLVISFTQKFYFATLKKKECSFRLNKPSCSKPCTNPLF